MKFQASKKSDLNIIDRFRFFLIELLIGQSMQAMINIKIIDGAVVLDKKALVCGCSFINTEIKDRLRCQ